MTQTAVEAGTARAIERAVLDYYEGWYDADVERIDRALHPDLVKRRAGEQLGITTKARMLELTAAGEGRADGADRTLEVELLHVQDELASVVVRAAVYHELLHLVRTGEGWKIANALWSPR